VTNLPAKSQFKPEFPIVDKDGRPSQLFRDYETKADALLTQIATGMNTLTSAANDAAAAAAGVGIGQLYRNGSVIQVRVA
jgi:hypothetical protein